MAFNYSYIERKKMFKNIIDKHSSIQQSLNYIEHSGILDIIDELYTEYDQKACDSDDEANIAKHGDDWVQITEALCELSDAGDKIQSLLDAIDTISSFKIAQ